MSPVVTIAAVASSLPGTSKPATMSIDFDESTGLKTTVLQTREYPAPWDSRQKEVQR